MEKAIVEKQQYKKDRTVEGNPEKRKAERKQTETITHETTGNRKKENRNIHLKV